MNKMVAISQCTVISLNLINVRSVRVYLLGLLDTNNYPDRTATGIQILFASQVPQPVVVFSPILLLLLQGIYPSLVFSIIFAPK